MHTTFTPLSALTGGMLIGLSAATLVLMNGRIAGISGILGAMLAGDRAHLYWRLAFLVGLLAGALGVTVLDPDAGDIAIEAPTPLLILGGLLVGFGTRLGNGCTSGHGVCGIARGAPRSIVATVTFFAVAVVTVFVVRQMVAG